MKNFDRSKIMIIAHSLKKEYKISFSEAQKLSWSNTKLRKSLHQGFTYFIYRKENGEIRNAVGTLHNIQHLLVGSDKFKNDKLTLRYYDLERRGFRSMKLINLISVKL